jgi:hypothetical protein
MYFRDLLNPIRYGRFAVMLFSHKLCRWLVPLSLPPALISAVYVIVQEPGLAIATCVAGGLLTAIAAARRTWLRILAYGLLVQAATISAWLRFIQGQQMAIWNPTSRSVPGVHAPAGVPLRVP